MINGGLFSSPTNVRHHNRPKRIIYASSGSGPLQMVSEPSFGRCANLLVVPRRGVDTRRCIIKDVGPQRGVDLGAVPHRLEERKSASEDAGPRRRVDCDVPHWLERRTDHHL